MCSIGTPVKVLYVVGSGHSGSTLLDIALGHHPEIASHGELANLPRGGWIANHYCSCGRRANDCPFWREVRRRWLKRAGVDGAESYAELQNTFERYRRWPRLLLERLRPSSQFRAYAEHTRALLETMREVSGKPIIVDSSKEPARAFALAMVPGVDLRLVHLVRDGRGVAMSLNRKNHPVWRTAVIWTMTNLASEWTLRRLGPGKSVRIRYESFVTNPKAALSEIGKMIRVDLTKVAHTLTVGNGVEVGHIIAGNRLRKSKSVRLRPDAGDWRSTFSTGKQRLFWALAGWLVRRYGYKR